MLRDVKDNAVGSLSTSLTSQLQSLQSLQARLSDIYSYLSKVSRGELPQNHQILYFLQDMLNALPDLQGGEMGRMINDAHGVLFLSGIVRSVLALHALIDNKIKNRESENGEQKKEEEKKEPSEEKKEGEAMEVEEKK